MRRPVRLASRGNTALDSAVFVERIRLLSDKRFDIVGNSVAAVLVAGIFWRLLPPWLSLTWLAAFALLMAGRTALLVHHRAAPTTVQTSERRARTITLTVFATASLWGLTGAIILVTREPAYEVLVVLVLAGMMSGGCISSAIYLPAMRAFVIPTIVPVIAFLLTRENATEIEMGGILAIFSTLLIFVGIKISRTLVESLRLRFEQASLVVDMLAGEDRFKFANMLLNTVMEASPDGILVVDANRAIISVNFRFMSMWGLPAVGRAALDDETALAAVVASVSDPVTFLARVTYLYDHPAESGDDEIPLRDGRFVDRRTACLATPTGEYLGRVWYFRDITERKRAESLAIRMARYDVLTGLANRSVFVEAIAQAIAQTSRGGRGFAVIYLDLDHFKDVNDTLGHPVGDELLQATAARLRSSIRADDTIARFGGDEFAVVVSNVSGPSDAASLSEAIIRALAEPFTVQGFEIRSGVSIGIDLYGPGASDAETLLSHADVALYRAKADGRNNYRFFTPEMDTEVRNRVTLGGELRAAIAGGQLFLLYQPQVAVPSGRVTGLEALVRWQHPERGILGPKVFIPVAESTGLIVGLGQWVLQTACRQAKAWLDAGIPPVRVAVNVSSLQFKMPLELEDNITETLERTGLPPRLLEIELTETVLMDVSLEHSLALARLRRRGVTIAIDDFGTGYSSLGYLRQFPVDRIKIAQDFVKDLVTTPEQAAIAKATIGLARDLAIAVIAEGVETREQLEALEGWGCNEIQGFYFAKPLSVGDATQLMRGGGVLAGHAYAGV